jgi:thiamine-phosphate pyrophosphorylase
MIETTSAHGGLAIAKAARLGLDAILVSTAFASRSPSATRPLGAIRLAKLQRAFPHARLYALGGINLTTAKALSRTRICGVALVSFSDVGKLP